MPNRGYRRIRSRILINRIVIPRQCPLVLGHGVLMIQLPVMAESTEAPDIDSQLDNHNGHH